VPSPSYVLTPTARSHLREAKAWSKARWGEERTTQYFHDLDQGARYLAEHYAQTSARSDLAGSSGLGVYPVREHYLIYEPIAERKVVIVAVLRQVRDIPALLSKYAYVFKRELDDIRKSEAPET
jgi:plasmid stabilization system protein ParE